MCIRKRGQGSERGVRCIKRGFISDIPLIRNSKKKRTGNLVCIQQIVVELIHEWRNQWANDLSYFSMACHTLPPTLSKELQWREDARTCWWSKTPALPPSQWMCSLCTLLETDLHYLDVPASKCWTSDELCLHPKAIQWQGKHMFTLSLIAVNPWFSSFHYYIEFLQVWFNFSRRKT